MKIYTAVDQYRAFAALGKALDAAEKDAAHVGDELAELRVEKAKAEAEYLRVKNATFVRSSKAGVNVARAIAEEASVDALTQWRLAEAKVKTAEDALMLRREIVRDIRQKMSNFQSVGSMARMEAEMAGRTGET